MSSTMSNGKRMNPFRSQTRTNFPPLDELDEFYNQPRATDAVNTSAISLDRSFQSRAYNELNFSVDMSIGGKAEMALHRYQVQKYGIDGGIHHEQHQGDGGSPDNSNGDEGGDAWDRVMDDKCSNVSFSSTAVAASSNKKVGYQTPSPDQSSDDDSGSSSFFGESIIQSLVTPEKVRFKMGDLNEQRNGVTLSRGQVHDDSSDSMDDSPDRSTNVSSSGSGFERMFHAALRFNDDFDEQSSFVKEEESFSADRLSGKDESRDKSSSVSFAADTSFAPTSGGRHTNKRQEDSSPRNDLKGLCLLSASPIDKKQHQDESFGALKGLNFLASPIHQQRNLGYVGGQSSPSVAVRSEISSLASPAGSTPRVSPNGGHPTALQSARQEVKTESSTTNLLLLGLSPIDSPAARSTLKIPSSVPFDEKHMTSSVPFDESFSHSGRRLDSQSLPIDVCTKKQLFPEESNEISPLSLEINHDGIELIQNKTSDLCCTNTTVKSSEESYFEDAPTTSLSEEASPFSFRRTFGSNASFRINADATNVGRTNRHIDKVGDYNQSCAGNRRGVRLSRLSKLKELGLEHTLTLSKKSSPEQYGDCSF